MSDEFPTVTATVIIQRNTYVDRLAQLAAFLDNVPDDRFDIMFWWKSDHLTGCAIGWACQLPEFQAQGLEYKEGYSQAPYFKGLWAFDAIMGFFDVDLAGAFHLFTVMGYEYNFLVKGPDVAGQIRRYLACPQPCQEAIRAASNWVAKQTEYYRALRAVGAL